MRVLGLPSLLLAAALASTAATAAGHDSRLYLYETDHLRLIYYDKHHEYIVEHLARSFENSLAFHRRLFDYTPSEKIVVLLQDFGDYGHGGTSTVPWNFISIGMEPFDYVYETMPANERMNWLMHHELVHVVATDKAAPADARFRRLFHGKVAPTDDDPISMLYSYLTSPRWYAARWYHEGIAVFLETWMSGGLGRVLGGYDEMVFRTMVLEDRRFYDVVGLESEGTTIDFQVGQNSYLYGTRFVTWLALTYGPEKLIAWFDRDAGSARYFSTQFEKVYGMPLSEAWSRWIAWEHAWQAHNLERVRRYPVTADRPVTRRALGSVSRSFVDPVRRRLYVAANYPAKPAHVSAVDLDTGEERILTSVKGPALYYVTSLAYDAAGGKLFFTTDNAHGWRDLREVDVETGKSRRLLRDFRAGDLVVDRADRSIWAVQHHNGLSSIVRIPPPYDAWQTLLTLPYGKDVFDLDISPDGSVLTASLIEINGRQRLVELETDRVRRGDGTYDVLWEFRNNSPENFVFSEDGRYLYGSSYYSGVSNLFRFDLETRKLDALTNAETGYFRPTPGLDGALVAFRYSAEGFVPVTLPIEVREDVEAIEYLGQRVVEDRPIVRTWNAGSPLEVDLAAVTKYSGVYRPGAHLGLASIYPVVEGYKDSAAVGAKLEVTDPVGLDRFGLTVAYSPDEALAANERIHAIAEYRHWPWTFRAEHNGSDFYDLFGPTKVGRKGTAVTVDFASYLVNDRPRTLEVRFRVGDYRNLDRLPDYQNVPVTIDAFQDAAAALEYSNFRRTIGAVDVERGLGWRLAVRGNYVDSELLTRAYATLDVGLPLPIPHSTLWLRPSIGYSFGDPARPFSNFYFGGFGNNWVDHGSVRRYREYYSLPGVELNDVEANNYGKLTIEWTLPAIRFRHAGWPALYSNWMQFSLFSEGITTNRNVDLPRRDVRDVGAQVDFKLVMFSNLESTLSFGYAIAFEPDRPRSTEFMGSLKILR